MANRFPLKCPRTGWWDAVLSLSGPPPAPPPTLQPGRGRGGDARFFMDDCLQVGFGGRQSRSHMPSFLLTMHPVD